MATCPRCETHYDESAGHRACPADGATLLPDAVFADVEGLLKRGDAVGEYTIEHLLGVGGFGAVYRAVQALIGKTVAIKVLNRACSSNPQVVSRFVAEARAVNQIQHRNIIDIFGFGQLPDGRQYYVMELLHGAPMDVWLDERGPISLSEALPILRPLARALDAAHAKGIAHRDLKPENVFLVMDEAAQADGAAPFPKLLDFGIAKLLSPESREGSEHRTHTGSPIGTPTFMSPEQCRGRGVDHRTDIYSFGILLYRMLTGHLPFSGGSFMEIAVQQMAGKPAAPSSIASMPEALSDRILWFMEKDPDKRPPTLAAGVRALESLEVPLDALAASPLGHSREFSVPPRPVAIANANPTPAEMAMAATIASLDVVPLPAATPSFIGAVPPEAATPSVRAPSRLVWAVVGALVLGAGSTALYLTRPAPAPTPPPEIPTSAAAPVTQAATAPASMTIHLVGAPPGAEIFSVDGRRLGGEDALVPRTGRPVEIELRAPGQKPRREILAADSDRREVEAHLEPVAPPSAPTTGATSTATAVGPPPPPPSVPASGATPPRKKPGRDDIETF